MIRKNMFHGCRRQETGSKSGTPTQIWLTDDLRDLAMLWPRSGDLGDARCYAFQCADILEVWCSTVGLARRTQLLFIAVLDAADRPLMLLALGIERRHLLRVLTFLDGGVCDYASPIIFSPVRDWNEDTVQALWQRLRQILPPFDVTILERMPDHVGDLPNPLMFLGTSRHSSSCHAITLSGTWDEFVENRLPRRQDSRRRRRQLDKLGMLTFEIAKTPDRCEAILGAIMSQKTRWYIETLGFNLLDRPGFRSYFQEAARRLSAPRPVHLSALKLDDTIISAHLGYVVGSRFYQYMPTYAGNLRRYAPGRLLHEHLIEWSFAQGLEFFDFGIGDEEYKNEYCDLVIPLHRVTIPVTIKGRIYLFLVALNGRLRKTKLWTFLKLLLQRDNTKRAGASGIHARIF